jgi:hypothetical protein
VGGVLTALPLVAGPTLWFFALEQGAPFAARAAHGTLLALISVGSYALAYAHASRRMAWPGALAFAVIAWTATTVVFYAHPIPALPGLATLAASCALAHWLMPAVGGPIVPGAPPRWDLTLRMSAAAALVLALTAAADWLGPSLSGFLASFPLATTILVAFTHAQRGPSGVVAFFRGFLPVLPVFGVFCVLLSVTLGRIPIAAAFLAALAIQVALQLIILWWMRR